MPVAIPIAIAASAAATVGAAAISSSASGKAASTQAAAAQQASQNTLEAQQQALALQQQQMGLTTANEAPYINYGTGALQQLGSLLGVQPAATSPIAQQTINNAQAIAAQQGAQLGATPAIGNPAIYPTNATQGTQTGVNPGPGFVTSMMNGLGSNRGLGQRGRPTPLQSQAALAGGIGSVGTVGSPTSLNGIPLNTTGALNSMALNEQWATPFVAPTASQAAATPGEQFILDTGTQALQNSAAAQGNLLSGSTLKGLQAYGSGLASTYYQQAYNNALNQYQQNYNIFNQNQNNQFNRLASLAGLGQTSVGQLASAGQNYANTGANTIMSGTAASNQALQNAAAATASGYVGGANAWGGALGNIGSLASLLALSKGGSSSYQPDPLTGILGLGSGSIPIAG